MSRDDRPERPYRRPYSERQQATPTSRSERRRRRTDLRSSTQFDLGRRAASLSIGQTLRRATEQLNMSDWMIIGTVALVVVAVLMIGMIGSRLAVGVRSSDSGATATAIALPTLVAQTEALAAPNPVPTPAPTFTSVVDTGGVAARLRAGPSLDAPILERLANGSQVAELGPDTADGPRRWRQVRSGSAEGWVEASLLRRVSPTPRESR